MAIRPDLIRQVDADFTKALPKIELHAHLSGSITRQCLHEIWQDIKNLNPDSTLEDPLTAIPHGKVDFDVNAFFPLFSKLQYQLCNTKASIIYATNSVLQDFQSDGVAYLELRTIPRTCSDLSKEGYVSTVLHCIRAFNENNDKLHTNLILSVDRKHTAAEAFEVIDLAIKFRAQGVVGVDLCGNPLRGDVSTFRDAFAKAKEAELGLTLHFAEVPQSSSLEELWMLLSFQPDRLGHVINVPEDVMEEIESRELGLELCLTCNVNAKLVSGGFADHHFGKWRGRRCPLIVCTDDVGIFCSPISNEYLLLAEHFVLDKMELLTLCARAVDSIFGSTAEKERLRRLLTPFTKEEIE